MYKKGHRLNFNDSRPITLLNIAYKIFAIPRSHHDRESSMWNKCDNSVLS